MSDTKQDISGFFTRAIQRDFLRDFLFRIDQIKFGAGGAEFEGDGDELVYATAASAPSRSIENIPVKYRGLDFNVPGSVKYGNAADYTVKFYCDANSQIYSKFLAETRRVFQDAAVTGNLNVDASTRSLRNGEGTTGDYRIAGNGAVLTMSLIDKQLNPIKTYNLIGLSIRDVSNMEFKMGDGKGDVQTFDVKMAYHYFEDTAINRFGATADFEMNGTFWPE